MVVVGIVEEEVVVGNQELLKQNALRFVGKMVVDHRLEEHH